MSLSIRPYAGKADLAAMQALLLSASPIFTYYPTAADLPEVLDPAVSDTPANTALWEDDQGSLVGFAIVSQYCNLHYHFLADALTAEVERAMIEWAMARMRRNACRYHDPVTLEAVARDDDHERTSLLIRYGFRSTESQTLSMARSLTTTFPDPAFPQGFTVRPLAGEREVAAYVAAHRAAYGTRNMTEELRLAIVRAAHYRPDLDLVVESPDRRLAAFCVCAIEDGENRQGNRHEGKIEIVGTRPEYRRMGLGRAAVLAGMQALKRAGMDRAALTVANWNRPAIHLYETLGFQVRWGLRWYSKPVT